MFCSKSLFESIFKNGGIQRCEWLIYSKVSDLYFIHNVYYLVGREMHAFTDFNVFKISIQ